MEPNQVQMLYGQREYGQAIAAYQQLREGGDPLPVAALFAGLSARALNDLFLARSILERAIDEQPTGRDLGQIRLALGTVLREAGDILAAVELLRAFVTDMYLYPELEVGFAAYGWANLGMALRQARRLDEAVSAYERAIAECQRDGLNDLLRITLQNLAWVHCLSGDVRRAEAVLEEAESLCESEEARWHQRIGQAFLESVAGDQRRAMELCELIADGPDSVPSDVRSHAYWLAGRVARSLGRLMEAEALASRAVTEALKARGENRCLQDASELLRDIRVWRKEAGAS